MKFKKGDHVIISGDLYELYKDRLIDKSAIVSGPVIHHVGSSLYTHFYLSPNFNDGDYDSVIISHLDHIELDTQYYREKRLGELLDPPK